MDLPCFEYSPIPSIFVLIVNSTLCQLVLVLISYAAPLAYVFI
jgi:hypothetical protein